MHGGTADPLLGHNSPRQEFIRKMRNSEEETFAKRQRVIRRIRMIITEARNISMEVQSGVSVLSELIDVMKNNREKWKTAEKDTSKALESVRKSGND